MYNRGGKCRGFLCWYSRGLEALLNPGGNTVFRVLDEVGRNPGGRLSVHHDGIARERVDYMNPVPASLGKMPPVRQEGRQVYWLACGWIHQVRLGRRVGAVKGAVVGPRHGVLTLYS